MPPILAPLAIFGIFFQEMWGVIKQPKYRSLLYWIVLLLVVGTVFYTRVEGWRWLDSLYFSVVTLTTVGYGDFSPSTDEGKLFTILYTLIGLGILASFLNMLARERRSMMEKRFSKNSTHEE